MNLINRKKNAVDSFSEFLQDETMAALCQSSHVMLLGDFSAHIGRQSEFVDEHFDIQEEFHCLQTIRHNSCGYEHVNYARSLLLDLAATGPLILTIGRGRGDTGLLCWVWQKPEHAS
jgi:hypothetical protein